MKRRMYLLIWFITGFTFLALIMFIYKYQYKLRSDYNIDVYKQTLENLARKSLETKDVPVSALLLYEDKVIGKGYNTVNRDTNPTGHAEINALKDCLKYIGFHKFNSLDKDKLILISTFEPCPMCLATMEEYNIYHAVFALPKSIFDKVSKIKKDLKYYNKLRETGNGRLQYDLFKLHPDFDSTKYKF